MKRLLNLFVVAALVMLPFSASRAILKIEITQGVSGALPIAVVPFATQGVSPSVNVAGVINADLGRSGRFKPFPEKDMLEKPTEAAQIDFKNWRVVGVDNLVIGRIKPGDNGGYVIEFQLFDVYRGQQLLGYSVPVSKGSLRWAAHHVSDMIYQKLTGQRGAFATRIAYVMAQKNGQGQEKRYSLIVADADGENPQSIVSSASPLMSPAWSPDGKRIAYVSFENKHSEIYVQDIASGKRQMVSGRPGINGAPAFSPDGSKLAMTLSTEPGNPDVYVMDLASRKLRQITDNPAIDTEPTWAPDGKTLLFTSDRGGGPQVYEVATDGGTPRRLTFEGSYNARPEVSDDGKLIAMVHQGRDGFHIAVMNRETEALQVLTDGRLDESPSFAPNGSMVIYATERNGQGVLAAVSSDGRVKQRLATQEGDVREPVWSPFLSGERTGN
ncbi:MAG: Tol-Pal system beta propeller repeat protein TolB [Gammaproteobacteria bacterium]|jgi:TolB protein